MERSLYSPAYDELRKWLIDNRVADEQLTLRVLADILDVHHSIPGKIEKSGRRLDVIEYVQYCDAIGADAAEGLEIIRKGLKKAKRK